MFYIKKNGVLKKISGRIQSLVASAIGFTPPTGMSATDVQDAVEEIVTLKQDKVKSYSFNATLDASGRTTINNPTGYTQYVSAVTTSGYAIIPYKQSNTEIGFKVLGAQSFSPASGTFDITLYYI